MKRCVAVIVLNWRNARDTVRCLESLVGIQQGICQIIVVDNGSEDDSVWTIRNAFPTLTTVELQTNLGYAGGNNAGIKLAIERGAEYVCLLNNDVTVTHGFLNPLLSVLDANPNVGIVTPLIANEGGGDPPIWALGANLNFRNGTVTRLHTGEPVSALVSVAPLLVDVAPGAAMLVRSKVYEDAGFMDERYFLYYEEIDWCFRLRSHGIRIMAVPGSIVYHKVSATLGGNSPVIDYYMTRNQLHLIRRHWSGAAQGSLWWRTVLRQLIVATAFTVKSQRGLRIPNRNARLFALRDALLDRWGPMGDDVKAACCKP